MSVCFLRYVLGKAGRLVKQGFYLVALGSRWDPWFTLHPKSGNSTPSAICGKEQKRSVTINHGNDISVIGIYLFPPRATPNCISYDIRRYHTRKKLNSARFTAGSVL